MTESEAEVASEQPPRPGVFSAYGLSHEERRVLVDQFAKALETAGPDYGDSVRALKQTVSTAEAIPVMGAIAMYLGSAPEGTNPEHDRPLGMFQHHIELCQAALLRDGASSGTLPLWRHVPDIAEAVQRYNEAWLALQAQKVVRSPDGDQKDLERLLLRLRLHASTRRGWAYESRLVPMLIDLLQPLDAETQRRLGFAPSHLVGWWAAMAERINARLDEHRVAVKDALEWPVDDGWASRIAERFGILPDPQIWTEAAKQDDEARRAYVIQCSDLRAHEIYRFELDELVVLMPGDANAETVKSILTAWSLSPGEDGGVGMQHLPLENPVIGRPFVRTDDASWHLFCGWLLLHNPFELIERLYEDENDLLASYMERRAAFLEERVAELFRRALPTATVERSLLSVDPRDNKEYENDIVAFISTFCVVVEAKAGRLHADARRGRSRVLRDRIEELLVRPSEQGQRLARRIVDGHGVLTFVRKEGGSRVVIDAAEIHRGLTVGVTLEPIADLLPRLTDVVESGISKQQAGALSYSISLPDLELIVDLLDHPSEVLHYLHRRSEIEQQTFLMGDEVDLLALYQQTGFNIGEREFSGHDTLDVTGLSDPIDVWHYRREAGLEAQKPRPDRTAWWEAVLSRVEERGGPRWAEIGVTLCNVAPPDQHEFEQGMKQLRRSIVSGERPSTDMVVLHNGPPQRRDVLIGLVAASPERAERQRQYDTAATKVMADFSAHRVTLLAWTFRPIDLPYFALVFYDATESGLETRPPT